MPPKAVSKIRAKPAADHVSYQDMITDAIVTLKERNGSSRVALKKYIKANNKNVVDGKMFDSLFNRALKSGVEKGLFAQPKGSSGGTKLAKKEPKPATAKPTAKATDVKDSERKDSEKKIVPKKVLSPKKAAAPIRSKVETTPKSKATKTKAPSKLKKATASSQALSIEKPIAICRTKSGRVIKGAAKPSAAKNTSKKVSAKAKS